MNNNKHHRMKKNIARTKAIYIMLSLTGTGVSRMIKMYTREPYSHASISLDEELDEMYSFARKKVHNPFNAGFIKEDINTGVFAAYKGTQCCIYRYMITEAQYEKIKIVIEDFKKEQDKYTYSYLGVVLLTIHKARRSAYKFFCSEFVAYMLEQAGENLFNKESELVRPFDIRTCKKLNKVYEGRLDEYRNYLSNQQNLYKEQNA